MGGERAIRLLSTKGGVGDGVGGLPPGAYGLHVAIIPRGMGAEEMERVE